VSFGVEFVDPSNVVSEDGESVGFFVSGIFFSVFNFEGSELRLELSDFSVLGDESDS